MEVKLRLQRAGNPAQKTHNWRIVAMSKTSPRDGRVLDILGYYAPATKPTDFKIDLIKADKWIKDGAIMSDTVRSLYKQAKKAA